MRRSCCARDMPAEASLPPAVDPGGLLGPCGGKRWPPPLVRLTDGGVPTTGSRSTGDNGPWPGSGVADRRRVCSHGTS